MLPTWARRHDAQAEPPTTDIGATVAARRPGPCELIPAKIIDDPAYREAGVVSSGRGG
jgi:hypothetical protein